MIDFLSKRAASETYLGFTWAKHEIKGGRRGGGEAGRRGGGEAGRRGGGRRQWIKGVRNVPNRHNEDGPKLQIIES